LPAPRPWIRLALFLSVEQQQLRPVGIYPQRFEAAHCVFALGGGRVRHAHSFTGIISIIAMVVIKIAKASGGGDFPPFD
jgi:hypothetical protein